MRLTAMKIAGPAPRARAQRGRPVSPTPRPSCVRPGGSARRAVDVQELLSQVDRRSATASAARASLGRAADRGGRGRPTRTSRARSPSTTASSCVDLREVTPSRRHRRCWTRRRPGAVRDPARGRAVTRVVVAVADPSPSAWPRSREAIGRPVRRQGRDALGHPPRHRHSYRALARSAPRSRRSRRATCCAARPTSSSTAQRQRGRAGRPGRAADHHPGAARPGLRHPHRAAGRPGAGPLPHRRRAARRARPARRRWGRRW